MGHGKELDYLTLEMLAEMGPPPVKAKLTLEVKWIGEQGDTIVITSPDVRGLHLGGPADREAHYMAMALPAVRTLLELSGLDWKAALMPVSTKAVN
jgi:hypothetical protein